MQRVKCLTAAALTLLLLSAPAPSQNNPGDVIAQKDTIFALELLSPIDTNSNKKGDRFDCKVLSPVEYSGATVSGYLRKVKSSGKANKKSEIDLAFDTLTLADGRVAGFNASVKEVNDVKGAGNDGLADTEGTVRGKSRVSVSVKRAATGALIGAGVGALLGGAKGAAIGAGIGAGIGITSTLATEGPNLEFKSGTQFTVVLNSASKLKETPSR